jgi:hypothetical protein
VCSGATSSASGGAGTGCYRLRMVTAAVPGAPYTWA